jgi:hypothetical protein
MPIRGDAKKVKDSMEEQYGKEKGEEVFYATANKQGRTPETWKKKGAYMDMYQKLAGEAPKPVAETDSMTDVKAATKPNKPAPGMWQQTKDLWAKTPKGLQWGAIGAGTGLALGALRYLLSRDKEKNVWTDILAPGAIGGLGGVGAYHGLRWLGGSDKKKPPQAAAKEQK